MILNEKKPTKILYLNLEHCTNVLILLFLVHAQQWYHKVYNNVTIKLNTAKGGSGKKSHPPLTMKRDCLTLEHFNFGWFWTSRGMYPPSDFKITPPLVVSIISNLSSHPLHDFGLREVLKFMLFSQLEACTHFTEEWDEN